MDEGLLSIISAVCGQLVKMLITLEPHGIFGSKFIYFNSVQSLLCKIVMRLAEHHFGWTRSFSENALTS